MRLAVEQWERARTISQRAELGTLDWEGLGKLVRAGTLEAAGKQFEALALSEAPHGAAIYSETNYGQRE